LIDVERFAYHGMDFDRSFKDQSHMNIHHHNMNKNARAEMYLNQVMGYPHFLSTESFRLTKSVE